MSILPSKINSGSASSSSSPAHQNPNLNHGSFFQHQQQPLPSLSPDPQISASDEPRILDSLRISESEQSVSVSNPISGAKTQTVANSGGSSRKVTYGRPNGLKRSPHQNSGSKACYVVQQEAGSSSACGEMSGTYGSPPSHRNGGAGRRSQMVSGNHLLNFQYSPIPRSQPSTRVLPPFRKPRNITPYNKDLFLQANYKFVVLDTGDYTVESMDPDKMLQWEDIICLKYTSPYPVQCPICLESPLCPQITSCGHIYCFPCILQYLMMGEENHKGDCFKKCPLCFIAISIKDLYTIFVENVKQYCIGDALEFVHLTRKKDSFTLNQKLEGGAAPKPCDSFSKFIVTSDVDLSVRQAIADLDSWLVKADSGLVDDLERLPYVCAAMEQLEQRKKYWNKHQHISSNKSCKTGDGSGCTFRSCSLGPETLSSDHNRSLDTITPETEDGVSTLVQTSDTDESQEGQDRSLSLSYEESRTLDVDPSGSGGIQEKDSYNFYQAVDGQHIILHPLNVKCLLHHYGSYELLPPRITGRILQLESVTQSEATRRRYRYLSHFPLAATFQLCEIDLSKTLPREALSPFMDEIKKRDKERKWRARKEHLEKVKADALAAESLPIVYDFGRPSYCDAPTFSMDDFEALGSSTSALTSPPIHGERKLFSSVAKLGFAAAHDSPSLKMNEAQPGNNMEGTSFPSSLNGSRNQDARSFADIMSKENTSDTRKTSESTKKGKKQNRVLLSTSASRRY